MNAKSAWINSRVLEIIKDRDEVLRIVKSAVESNASEFFDVSVSLSRMNHSAVEKMQLLIVKLAERKAQEEYSFIAA